MKNLGGLCVITDMAIQNKYNHVEIAEMAIKGGADMIQFRDKFMSTSELIDTANEIKKLCQKSNVTFIINDRVDISMIVDADGVHLGQEDMPIDHARSLMGKDKIIGISTHSRLHAWDAQINGADYIGFGHVFKTESKLKSIKPKGVEKLRNLISAIDLPIFAIGGINIENALSVMETGVHGIAVIGAVVKASDPFDAVRRLKKIVYAQEK